MIGVAAAAPESAQEAINGRLYRQQNLVRTYKTTKLAPAEAVSLIRYRDQIEDCRVLDLGCGAGRLMTYLRPLAREIVGLDVSAHMIAHCRQAFPDLKFLEGDMRDLSPLADETFDSVLAVSNLFDAVSHDERLIVLAEVRRVMVSGGLLIFSAHNREFEHAGAGPRLEFHRNPLTQLRMIVDYLQAAANHRRIKPLHRFEAEYALLNDSGNNFHTLHYYISREQQARQLDASGFELLECLDEFGLTLPVNDPGRANPSLMYIARKP